MDKRGSRRKGSQRAARAARAEAEGRRDYSRVRTWFKRLALWGGGLAVLGLVFLAIAVAFAARSLPSYYQLKATQTAQTIVVRARDGSELVEIGPSYGRWLTYPVIVCTLSTIRQVTKRCLSFLRLTTTRKWMMAGLISRA